jgi:hypothetical protein
VKISLLPSMRTTVLLLVIALCRTPPPLALKVACSNYQTFLICSHSSRVKHSSGTILNFSKKDGVELVHLRGFLGGFTAGSTGGSRVLRGRSRTGLLTEGSLPFAYARVCASVIKSERGR